MTAPLWKQAADRWRESDPDRFEDFMERVALILEGCSSEGITEEQAERRAFDCVAEQRTRPSEEPRK